MARKKDYKKLYEDLVEENNAEIELSAHFRSAWENIDKKFDDTYDAFENLINGLDGFSVANYLISIQRVKREAEEKKYKEYINSLECDEE